MASVTTCGSVFFFNDTSRCEEAGDHTTGPAISGQPG